MTLIELILTSLTCLSVGLPLLLAILARRSPVSLRIILALAGGIPGLFVLVSYVEGLGRARSDHSGGIAIAVAPLFYSVLSFYIVLTGFSSIVTYEHFRAGGPATPAMLLLAAIALCCLAFGVFAVVLSFEHYFR